MIGQWHDGYAGAYQMIGQWHDPLAFVLCIVGYIGIHIGWHLWKTEERKRYEIRHDYTIRNGR